MQKLIEFKTKLKLVPKFYNRTTIALRPIRFHLYLHFHARPHLRHTRAHLAFILMSNNKIILLQLNFNIFINFSTKNK